MALWPNTDNTDNRVFDEFSFSTKDSIEVISVGMERSNGIPMKIFRRSTIVGCFFMGLLFREHPKAHPGG